MPPASTDASHPSTPAFNHNWVKQLQDLLSSAVTREKKLVHELQKCKLALESKTAYADNLYKTNQSLRQDTTQWINRLKLQMQTTLNRLNVAEKENDSLRNDIKRQNNYIIRLEGELKTKNAF